ncbi:hypothetical protein M2G84_03425, partial [Vibrio vulnificus]|nr:hypothetical protein [Vibrio vulnificus]
RKPINRFPIVSHQKDRSTDPYLIYIVLYLAGLFIILAMSSEANTPVDFTHLPLAAQTHKPLSSCIKHSVCHLSSIVKTSPLSSRHKKRCQIQKTP